LRSAIIYLHAPSKNPAGIFTNYCEALGQYGSKEIIKDRTP
jgi:hypothetical protein